mmetsp:Transcript_5170/g.8301  ORF Transcript_5170/g.8301 Transcript_5170/m.8301 type:complete len:137 (+) Transcript_5170:367-777(+)|eukprot:CAMPEP_0194578832 /NCGR_PEP_ID=MMETSP0292-20121207/13117_1 /TAXON_ID=39354 /ORGANISM="Heterosigma akashiwo, Strain CCMP2393" /LENGTH=136 /DNA_ID=CAMNT_0039431615 /DNA_START=337 /DNA_END=747 /DNA_ORIENTATION=-
MILSDEPETGAHSDAFTLSEGISASNVVMSNIPLSFPFFSDTEPFSRPGSSGKLVPFAFPLLGGAGGLLLFFFAADDKKGELPTPPSSSRKEKKLFSGSMKENDRKKGESGGSGGPLCETSLALNGRAATSCSRLE